MLPNNFRIVETGLGYSIFKVFYDSTGIVVGRSERPVIECYADDACGVTDWLEAISLAAEKPSISLSDMLKAEQDAHTGQELRDNGDGKPTDPG